MIAQGRELLDRSAAGDELTAYHVEAAITAVDAAAPTVAGTDWNAIVTLYDRLMEIAPSAVVALNRAIAIAQRDGHDQGIEASSASRIVTGSKRTRSCPRRWASWSGAKATWTTPGTTLDERSGSRGATPSGVTSRAHQDSAPLAWPNGGWCAVADPGMVRGAAKLSKGGARD